MSALTKIYCPKCEQPIEVDGDLMGEQLLCPACGHEFVPFAPGDALPLKPATQQVWSAEERKLISPAEQISKHRKKIRGHAESFTMFAVGFMIVAVLALLAWVIANYTNSQISAPDQTEAAASAGAEMVFGFCVKASVVCYLVAQVIHIRANTEGKL